MTPDELADRTKQFGVRCVQMCDALPRRSGGFAISNQLVRSSTSVGANYRAARRARSSNEFIAKLHIVREEVDESLYWLEVVRDLGYIPAARLDALLDEAEQLTRIINASLTTSRNRRSSNHKSPDHKSLNQKSP